MNRIVCSNGTIIRIRSASTEIRLPSGRTVRGEPQGTEEQAATAARLGYDSPLAMVLDHDPLHALLCSWLGMATSLSLSSAVGEMQKSDRPLADLEESAVIAVQEFMRKAGGRLPQRD